MRLHPAASRVKKLAEEIPAALVFWDILCLDDEDLRSVPLRERRARLEKLLAHAKPPIHLTRRRPSAPSRRTGSSGSRARGSTA